MLGNSDARSGANDGIDATVRADSCLLVVYPVEDLCGEKYLSAVKATTICACKNFRFVL